jgi:hypothetical protein
LCKKRTCVSIALIFCASMVVFFCCLLFDRVFGLPRLPFLVFERKSINRTAAYWPIDQMINLFIRGLTARTVLTLAVTTPSPPSALRHCLVL